MAKQTIQFRLKSRRQRSGGQTTWMARASSAFRTAPVRPKEGVVPAAPSSGDSEALLARTLSSISTLDRGLRDVIALVRQIVPDIHAPGRPGADPVSAALDGGAAYRHKAAPSLRALGTPAADHAGGLQYPATRPAREAFDPVLEQTPIRLHDPLQERLRQRAATAVLNGTEWLTSAQVDALAPGADKRSNAHARANRLLAEGRVFAIEHGGRKHYPRYAFDALGTPYPALREVLQAYGDAAPLRVASWFESASAALDGRRPRELLDSDPAAVVRAAREHVAGPVHG